MPASSARLGVRFLRPWMPAENDPAEPNALTQSLQLTCSLTPSSTLPSTRLVIIWLKRWPARPPIEAPLESAPVTGGGGVDTGGGQVPPSYGLHSTGACCVGGACVGGVVGCDEGQFSKHSLSAPPDCACACGAFRAKAHTAATANAMTRLRTILIMVSARTACRDHRRGAACWPG